MGVWDRYWGGRRQRILFVPRLLFNKLFILRLTHYVLGSQMLEVGSGTSNCMSLLREYGYTCVGIDRSELAVRLAERANHSIVRADAAFLPFKDQTFDMAYAQGLFEHLLDVEIRSIVLEMKRVAKRVAFTLPPKRGLFNIAENLANLINMEFVFPKARYFSKNEVKNILRDIFNVLRIEWFLVLNYFVTAE